MTILINLAQVNYVTRTEIFNVQKQPSEKFLNVSQNSQGNAYVRVSFFNIEILLKRDF